MPVKVNNIHIEVRHRNTRKPRLFKQEEAYKTNYISYNGNNIMKNSHFNPLQSFVFKIVDKINLIEDKHPKIVNKIIKISEAILKKSDI